MTTPADPRFVRIARSFHWEMGHRLPFHTSGCANIHGHSYTCMVELGGVPDAHGMVIDYGDLKALVQPVIERMDHAFMVDEGDSLMLEVLGRAGLKTYRVPFHSTAENIALHLLDLLWECLVVPHPHIASLRLRLQETVNSYAEVSREKGVIP